MPRKLEPGLAIQLIRLCLTDDLRKTKYKGHPNKYWGHCYIASEALYHLIKRNLGFRPCYTHLPDGGTHWFLMTPCDGQILDPTWDQFPKRERGMWIYTNAISCGFLTKNPSNRAKELIRRVRQRL